MNIFRFLNYILNIFKKLFSALDEINTPLKSPGTLIITLNYAVQYRFYTILILIK